MKIQSLPNRIISGFASVALVLTMCPLALSVTAETAEAVDGEVLSEPNFPEESTANPQFNITAPLFVTFGGSTGYDISNPVSNVTAPTYFENNGRFGVHVSKIESTENTTGGTTEGGTTGGGTTDPSGGETPTNPSGEEPTDPSGGETPTNPSGEEPTDPSGGETPTPTEAIPVLRAKSGDLSKMNVFSLYQTGKTEQNVDFGFNSTKTASAFGKGKGEAEFPKNYFFAESGKKIDLTYRLNLTNSTTVAGVNAEINPDLATAEGATFYPLATVKYTFSASGIWLHDLVDDTYYIADQIEAQSNDIAQKANKPTEKSEQSEWTSTSSYYDRYIGYLQNTRAYDCKMFLRNQDVDCYLVGINHDKLATPIPIPETTETTEPKQQERAGLTFWANYSGDVLISSSGKMNGSATSAGGWKESYARKTINTSSAYGLATLTTDTINIIKPVYKKSISEITRNGDEVSLSYCETVDKLFDISDPELRNYRVTDNNFYYAGMRYFGELCRGGKSFWLRDVASEISFYYMNKNHDKYNNVWDANADATWSAHLPLFCI
ncbi:hypothetical protein [Adlercreutzia sp. ZJ154]|uniref:hypothetical protein n=1 Tax=Adlercreutzia sp. ZJ154 TaxID=2709790 RepID=UPI0013ECFFDA|nr:hypothetical protein [Adlercreutzia sp. ZJ154]